MTNFNNPKKIISSTREEQIQKQLQLLEQYKNQMLSLEQKIIQSKKQLQKLYTLE